MKRIIFGEEVKMQIFASKCPGCDVSHGSWHSYGCPLESCPQCGSRLIHCSCKALDMLDGIHTAEAISESITDKAEIHRAIKNGSEGLTQSYYEEGVLLWIVGDLLARDPGIDDFLMKNFGIRKVGDRFAINAADAAECMGVPIEKAEEVLAELQADSDYRGWDEHEGTVH